MKNFTMHFLVLVSLGLSLIGIKTFAVDQKKEELGVWVWSPIAEMNGSDMESLLDRAHAEGFTALYATIDSVLTVLENTNQKERDEQLQRYTTGLAEFIARAQRRGIAVDAVAGARDWAEAPHREKPRLILFFFAEYQQAYPQARFRSLQFDIEPYLLPEYEKNKRRALAEYISLIDELAASAKKKQIQLDFVIPHFYDSHVKWTPAISYKGKTAYVFDHIVTILQALPSSTILVMAYRNSALGDDGSLALSQHEVEQLSRENKKNVSVVIAQEVGNVDPDYVTFYGTSKNRLIEEVDKIREAFSKHASFKGLAIHYWDPFFELE